jgi:hypothetical protein
MAFFTSGIEMLQKLVVALGGGFPMRSTLHAPPAAVCPMAVSVLVKRVYYIKIRERGQTYELRYNP